MHYEITSSVLNNWCTVHFMIVFFYLRCIWHTWIPELTDNIFTSKMHPHTFRNAFPKTVKHMFNSFEIMNFMMVYAWLQFCINIWETEDNLYRNCFILKVYLQDWKDISLEIISSYRNEYIVLLNFQYVDKARLEIYTISNYFNDGWHSKH